ncbi:unnamed protein product [Lymnaea stagnalis]|uniref:Protein SPEC3 n=1 Tax=Lymnaea stagnalis TaxID=6523 RepID=A0AAV2H0W0_LYMST
MQVVYSGGSSPSPRPPRKTGYGRPILPGYMTHVHPHVMVHRSREKPTEGDHSLRDSIPAMTQGLAALCLVLNIILPGSGTVTAGMSVLFCSYVRPKGTSKGHCVWVNVGVGVVQFLLTFIFLMGWIWSIMWGVAFISISKECYRDLQQSATSGNSVDKARPGMATETRPVNKTVARHRQEAQHDHRQGHGRQETQHNNRQGNVRHDAHHKREVHRTAEPSATHTSSDAPGESGNNTKLQHEAGSTTGGSCSASHEDSCSASHEDSCSTSHEDGGHSKDRTKQGKNGSGIEEGNLTGKERTGSGSDNTARQQEVVRPLTIVSPVYPPILALQTLAPEPGSQLTRPPAPHETIMKAGTRRMKMLKRKLSDNDLSPFVLTHQQLEAIVIHDLPVIASSSHEETDEGRGLPKS